MAGGGTYYLPLILEAERKQHDEGLALLAKPLPPPGPVVSLPPIHQSEPPEMDE